MVKVGAWTEGSKALGRAECRNLCVAWPGSQIVFGWQVEMDRSGLIGKIQTPKKHEEQKISV